MKNTLRITATAVLTLIGTASFGQSLNFNGGFTASTIKMEGMKDESSTETMDGNSYNSSTNYKCTNGFNAAIGYEFKLGKRLSLETGLKFQTRGYKMEYKFSNRNEYENFNMFSSGSYKMNYLDLPIVLNTAILTGDFKVYARTGIYAGFMTGAKYKGRYEYTSSNGDNGSEEYSEKIATEDLDGRYTGGLVLGAGAEYKGFYFEANYNLGVASLEDFDNKIYTNDLSFSLGYKLKFKKKYDFN
jgi:hypothetical protein